MKRVKYIGKRYRADGPLYCHDCGYRCKHYNVTCPKCDSTRLSVRPRRHLAPKEATA